MLQHLTQVGAAFLPPFPALIAPFCAISSGTPWAKADSGTPEDAWNRTVCKGLSLQCSPEMPVHRDLQRPPLSTPEPLGRALQLETQAAWEFTWHTGEFLRGKSKTSHLLILS